MDLYDNGYSCAQLGLGQVATGDINQDGILNVLDVVELVNIILAPGNQSETSIYNFIKHTFTSDLNALKTNNISGITSLVKFIGKEIAF